MMKEQHSSTVEMGPTFTITGFKAQSALPVSRDDWTHMRKMVEQVNADWPYLHTMAAVISGTCLASLIGSVSELFVKDSSRQFEMWLIFAGLLILTIALWILERKQQKFVNFARDHVIAEMDHIESKYATEEISEQL